MSEAGTISAPNKMGRLRQWVVKETSGGMLLLAAAAIALIWANTPWGDLYHSLAGFEFGPESLGLNLSAAAWASDALLALFFFLVGVELKHDLAVGALRNLKQAAVPVLAAMGGMVVPAVIFASVVLAAGDRTALNGWAIPVATDIAFALAVLAVFGRGLPRALRVFMMTLAVVDDLLAIVIIAIFYTSQLRPLMLLGTVVAAAAFFYVVRTRHRPWYLLVALGLIAWWFMHASGVHATIAGVVLGFCVPARPIHKEYQPRTVQIVDRLQPLSAGIVLPIFAFFAAGVTVSSGDGGAGRVLLQPVVLAIVAGLVVGKVTGVMLTTVLVTKLTPLRLPDSITLRDLFPVGMICGIGFTVALLIADLSFVDSEHAAGGKIGVLLGTAISAVLGAILLRWAARHPQRTAAGKSAALDEPVAEITGQETRGLAWDPEILAALDDDQLPDPDLEHMARLDGLELGSLEEEFINHIEEEREFQWGPASDDEDGDERRYL